MQNVEGDVQKMEGNCYRVLMCEGHEEDTISDIRVRIINALQKAFSKNQSLVDEVRGKLDFFV